MVKDELAEKIKKHFEAADEEESKSEKEKELVDGEEMSNKVEISKKRKEMKKAGGKVDYSKNIVDIAMSKVK